MLTKLIEGVKVSIQAREFESALKALSDATLDDIGLTRPGIASLYSRPAPVRPKQDLTFDWLSLNLALPDSARVA
ncbi:hypothetical protein [Methylobacterium oryzisoli]|uniref:hypothetical protein n=1 Tax=Methylobacterium oryzisoli TaxID=3385502 RepID=UPI003891C04F